MSLRTDRQWSPVLLDQPEVWGIESVSPDAIVLRAVARTRTSARDDVARELRARIKRALDRADIVLPTVQEIRIHDPAARDRVADPESE